MVNLSRGLRELNWRMKTLGLLLLHGLLETSTKPDDTLKSELVTYQVPSLLP